MHTLNESFLDRHAPTHLTFASDAISTLFRNCALHQFLPLSIGGHRHSPNAYLGWLPSGCWKRGRDAGRHTADGSRLHAGRKAAWVTLEPSLLSRGRHLAAWRGRDAERCVAAGQ